MPPLLSIVMPTYNGEKFIAFALESVRAQEVDDLELIVVDDGSSDRTLEIVRCFSQHLPIRILTPVRSGNWVAVTNIGLREATGEWACFLHQDDLWFPGRLAAIRPEMQNLQTLFVLHNAVFVDPNGEPLGPWTCPLPEGLVPSNEFIERLLIQNFIAIPSPTFRRRVVVESGGLDESLWFSADWDLWLRLGAMAPVRFLANTLTAFRVHPASQTAARKLRPNEWQQQLTTVLDRHLPGWSKNANQKELVERIAKTSISINSSLAALSRGESVRHSDLVVPLLALGPAGWRRYLRDSRIIERVGSRLRVQHRRKRSTAKTKSKEAAS
jgi:hypothetical protein